MSETDHTNNSNNSNNSNNTNHRAEMVDGEGRADPQETASAEIAESLATESNLPEPNTTVVGTSPQTDANTGDDPDPDR